MQKVIFQRVKTTTFIEVLEIPVLANVNTFLSANDSKKMLVSPFLQNPTTEPGAARTFGGGNQTLGGIELVIGREATAFTGVIYQETQSTIATLKKLQCENVGVFLIDENGNIGCYAESTTDGVVLKPIPISNLFIGDKYLGGLEEPDSNAIQWSFLPNWSDDLVIVKKAGGELLGSQYDSFLYNPLTDLVNIAST